MMTAALWPAFLSLHTWWPTTQSLWSVAWFCYWLFWMCSRQSYILCISSLPPLAAFVGQPTCNNQLTPMEITTLIVEVQRLLLKIILLNSRYIPFFVNCVVLRYLILLGSDLLVLHLHWRKLNKTILKDTEVGPKNQLHLIFLSISNIYVNQSIFSLFFFTVYSASV